MQPDLRRDRYYLVAVTCLIIAAKYEEREEGCVPSPAQLLDYLRRQGQANDFAEPRYVHSTEVSILTMLNWGLTIVTPLHYLGIFHRRGLVFLSDTMGFEPLVPKVLEYLKKYSDFYSDLCLQSYEFNAVPASLLAAAIALAARKAINLRPLWNPALEAVLGYPEAVVAAPYERVWGNYAALFPDDARMALKREKAAEKKFAAAQQAAEAAAAAAAASAGAGGAGAGAGAGGMMLLSPAAGAGPAAGGGAGGVGGDAMLMSPAGGASFAMSLAAAMTPGMTPGSAVTTSVASAEEVMSAFSASASGDVLVSPVVSDDVLQWRR